MVMMCSIKNIASTMPGICHTVGILLRFAPCSRRFRCLSRDVHSWVTPLTSVLFSLSIPLAGLRRVSVSGRANFSEDEARGGPPGGNQQHQ